MFMLGAGIAADSMPDAGRLVELDDAAARDRRAVSIDRRRDGIVASSRPPIARDRGHASPSPTDPRTASSPRLVAAIAVRDQPSLRAAR